MNKNGDDGPSCYPLEIIVALSASDQWFQTVKLSQHSTAKDILEGVANVFVKLQNPALWLITIPGGAQRMLLPEDNVLQLYETGSRFRLVALPNGDKNTFIMEIIVKILADAICMEEKVLLKPILLLSSPVDVESNPRSSHGSLLFSPEHKSPTVPINIERIMKILDGRMRQSAMKRTCRFQNEEPHIPDHKEMLLKNNTEDGLAVEQFKIMGRGVVAIRKFQRNEYVCEYKGTLLDSEPNFDDDYLFEFKLNGRRYWIDARTEDGSFGRLVNAAPFKEPEKVNCKPAAVKIGGCPRLYLYATKAVAPGEQFFYDYGERRNSVLEANPWLAHSGE